MLISENVYTFYRACYPSSPNKPKRAIFRKNRPKPAPKKNNGPDPKQAKQTTGTKVDLKIKDKMKSEVMHLLARQAKHFEKLADLQETDGKDSEAVRELSKDYWALVRQFPGPGRTGETDG